MASHTSVLRVNNLVPGRSMPFVARRQPSEGGLLFPLGILLGSSTSVDRGTFLTQALDELQSVIAFLF
jgi:hypothetical protein